MDQESIHYITHKVPYLKFRDTPINVVHIIFLSEARVAKEKIERMASPRNFAVLVHLEEKDTSNFENLKSTERVHGCSRKQDI